jgi:type IV fimbrial biogenesis protein FimT
MLRRRRPQRGVTLIELMVGLTVLAIFLMYAGPSFATWMNNSRIRNTADALVAGLQYAKAEAVSRNARVRFQFVTTLDAACAPSASGRNWVVNLDPANDPDAVAGNCDAAPSDTAAPRILQARPAADGSGVTSVDSPVSTLVFNGLGRITPVPAGQVTIDITNPAAGTCALDGGDLNCLRVVVSPAGQVRMCNPKFANTDPQGCPP